MKKLLTFMLLLSLFLFSFDYTGQWTEVEKLDKERLPKSALEKVELIYTEAKKEQNETQLIKALLHKEKFLFSQNENAYTQSIYNIEKELQGEIPKNTKLILTSFLAELYGKYLDKQRYKIGQRTSVKDNQSFSSRQKKRWEE